MPETGNPARRCQFVFFFECEIYSKNFKYYGVNAVKLDSVSLCRCLRSIASIIDGINQLFIINEQSVPSSGTFQLQPSVACSVVHAVARLHYTANKKKIILCHFIYN